jgi:hypothetical protein
MKSDWVKRNKWVYLLIPPVIVLFTWGFGEVVMHLWNWLLPTLFGWHQISFWQGLGLLVLCRILFGGFGGHGNGSGHRRWKADRWQCMTNEERERFREEMRNRWRRVGAPESEAQEPAGD